MNSDRFQSSTFCISLSIHLKVLEVLIISLSHLLGICCAVNVFLGVDVETLRVAGESHGWEDRSFLASVVDVVPVDATEEGVFFHPGCSAAYVAQPSGPVDCAELADDILGFVAYGRVLGENDGLFDDSG